ncbi:MAG: exodeoxyribonuclease III [Candidatus Rehaiarchaeum fermentans]|nr:exodeoxyribonuclease III [Candidatus Rehaiarchaeum fermentans]MCW1302643.1 exodeoxyribonuclease III [Candidatus Rehaiarchaeum fermentans]
MKLLSWNINGIKSALNKGLREIINSEIYDVILLQETKSEISIETTYKFYNFQAKRKGYSGVATLTKKEALSVTYGIGIEKYDAEGRVITTEFEDFFILNCYFPNAQHGLTRLKFKLEFNKEFEKYVEKLRARKPIIIGGDFNVAHEEIDIARPKDNINNPGFTQAERDWMTHFLSLGYIDTYRMFVKEGGHYSWWTYRFNARSRNIGWRIDYFIVSKELEKRVKKADILTNVYGSDHAPVYLEIE